MLYVLGFKFDNEASEQKQEDQIDKIQHLEERGLNCDNAWSRCLKMQQDHSSGDIISYLLSCSAL